MALNLFLSIMKPEHKEKLGIDKIVADLRQRIAADKVIADLKEKITSDPVVVKALCDLKELQDIKLENKGNFFLYKQKEVLKFLSMSGHEIG